MIQILGQLEDVETLDLLAQLLKEGQSVGVPTDTSYALVASALSTQGVGTLLAALNLDHSTALTVLLHDRRLLPAYATASDRVKKFSAENWPGQVTLVLRRAQHLRLPFDADGATISLRVPGNPALRELIARVGPITATSVAVGGERATDHLSASRLLSNSAVRALAQGADTPITRSTILDATQDEWRLLRRGSFPWPDCDVDGVTGAGEDLDPDAS